MKVLHNGIYHLVNVHDHLSPPINPLEHPHPLEQSSIGCGEILNPQNLGPNRTRTSKILKISDRTGPGPTKFGKSRTEPDQDQQNLENLGPNRTRTSKI